MMNEDLNNLQSEIYEHLWNGRYRLALTAAEKLYSLRPNDPEAIISLAWAYLENGNPTKALDYANLAVELDSDSSRIRFHRAYLLSRMCIYEGALADINKSIDNELNLLKWTLSTKIRSLAGLKKYKEALDLLNRSPFLRADDNAKLSYLKTLLEQAVLISDIDKKIGKKDSEKILGLASDAINKKEYWFALLVSEKLLQHSEYYRDEAELINIESMYYLFQYLPAFRKADKLKDKFAKNKKFNFIYNALIKFMETEDYEEEPSLKLTNENKIALPDLSKTSEKTSAFKTNSLLYPNDFIKLISIKIFDPERESKTKVREYYKQIDKRCNWISVEVIFDNPEFNIKDGEYNCKIVAYIDDMEAGITNFKLNVPKEWDSVIFTQNIGSDLPGFWKKGQGKLELYVNEFKVGEKYFGINDFYIKEKEEKHEEKRKIIKTKERENIVKPPDDKSLEELLEELDSFIGLKNIKQTVRDFITYLEFIKERKKYGLKSEENIAINAVFLGNPGTGKTTIARLIGNILRAMGILPSGHVVEVDRAALVGQYIGETAQKTEKVIQDALGGVLFIDEAYTLIKKSGSAQDFGQEAVDILLKRMEDKKGEFVVIAAGYPEEMNNFLESNPGLKSRFTHTFVFEDYTPDELVEIFKMSAKSEDYRLDKEAEEFLNKELINLYRNRDKSFGNARLIKKILDESKLNLSKRILSLPDSERSKEKLTTITVSDIQNVFKPEKGKSYKTPINEELLSEALDELDNLVGLAGVKKEINELVKLARFFAEEGENLTEKFSDHYLFLGNPGTGKTTVARLFSKIFSALGILSKGHLVETDRQGLVAGYVGQTAEKTKAVIDKAIGGTLFIDEAYALTKSGGSNSDFGREAIDILLKRMEDDRGKFIVIAAGYTEEMKQFVYSNPGLESRFTKSIVFEDYTPDEMMEIIKRALSSDNKKLAPDAEEALLSYFRDLYKHRDRKFGNARIVRNLLERLKKKLLLRIADIDPKDRTEDVMNTIILEDINEVTGIIYNAREYRVKGDPLKLQEYMDELNSLVGLENVKEGILKLISGSKIAQLKREKGLHVIEKNLNTIFIGNDGTGKTTVAKLFGNILRELGILSKGHLVKVERADLVRNFQDSTQLRAEELIKDSLGGILMIDNFSTLFTEDFGKEAFDAILNGITRHKNKFVVILADNFEAATSVIEKNPDLSAYFSQALYFEDYTPRQLLAVAYYIADKHGYLLDEGALQMLLEIFNELYEKRDVNFRNAMTARNILYTAISNQENRIASLINPSDEDLKTIRLEDVQKIKF
ncbi:AAA family ATPase [Melioribacter roseus P3M-2]|uniref:AAA family ATPase n=1 Tax=Melioribacter roseus (strain DSM 23840 / JCM 17771 / VKM B-2668 / P3M-2) TaxID=1191523 RepID=I7A3B1_MELRP|nr:AAA family ATPase [Melioribacter roseus]AFN75708.1 AAA family ATPase [Melioribacter roseus P3M-2]